MERPRGRLTARGPLASPLFNLRGVDLREAPLLYLSEVREIFSVRYRTDVAVNKMRSKAIETGNLGNSRLNFEINDDTKAGFADYMDRSIAFIRHVAAGSQTRN